MTEMKGGKQNAKHFNRHRLMRKRAFKKKPQNWGFIDEPPIKLTYHRIVMVRILERSIPTVDKNVVRRIILIFVSPSPSSA